jgi:hypothetical protein
VLLSGCGGRQPLPRLNYQASTPMGPELRVPTSVSLETGRSIGHSSTTYALMPGGFMMPINTGPSTTGAFNVEDQAAFVENLVRVLTERRVVQLVGSDADPLATIVVKFLKTEHFPDMQDYVLDVLVTARMADKSYERVHHVSTMDQVDLVTRMFLQNGGDGRRRAAELLLAAVVEDLEKWFASPESGNAGTTGTYLVSMPFEECSRELVRFLRMRYARPSTFWKGGISVSAVKPTESVVVVELRWSDAQGLPPFCMIDVHAEPNGTRIAIRESERIRLLETKVQVAEGIEEFVREIQPAVLTGSPTDRPQ